MSSQQAKGMEKPRACWLVIEVSYSISLYLRYLSTLSAVCMAHNFELFPKFDTIDDEFILTERTRFRPEIPGRLITLEAPL